MSMPLSDFRDAQQERWRAGEMRNYDARIERRRIRNKERQDATQATAVRKGMPWTDEEFEAVMESTNLTETAIRIGRTYQACVLARQRRREMLGLAVTRIKSEDDRYDGSDVTPRVLPKGSQTRENAL